MKIEVTEYQLIERQCGCGHRTKAMPPDGAEHAVSRSPLSGVANRLGETGIRVEGKLAWMYCARTTQIHPAHDPPQVRARRSPRPSPSRGSRRLTYFDALIKLTEGWPWMPVAA